MILRFLTFSLGVFGLVNVSFSQSIDKAISFGGLQWDFAHDMTVDNLGNIIVVGEFSDSVDFDPGPGTHFLVGDSANDAFIAKYDSSLKFLWVKQVKSKGNDWASAVKSDASGNIFVAGMYSDTALFVGTSSVLFNNYPGWDCFLVKYNGSGVLQWVEGYGGRGSDESYHIELGGNGNIYIGGLSQDSLNFNNGSNKHQFFGWYGYIAKFNNSGVFSNLIYMGGWGITDVRSFQVDNAGNIYCTGAYSSKAYFDSGLNNDSLISNGAFDSYMAKYNNAGSLNWVVGIGGNQQDYGEGISIDGQGNIYWTGNFSSTAVDFNPGTGTHNLSASGDDIFITKYDTSGNYLWAKKVGGGSDDTPHQVLVYNDLLYLTGYFSGTADFDPSFQTHNIVSNGQEDVFLAAFNTNGGLFWASGFGSSGVEWGSAIDFSPSGSLVVNGSMSNTVDFDLDSTFYLVSGNSRPDIFIAKYDVPICQNPDIPTIVVSDSALCQSGNVSITVSPADSLRDATLWRLYEDSCGQNNIGSSSSGIFNISVSSSTDYFVRGEGGCIIPGMCEKVSVQVTNLNNGISQIDSLLTSSADSVNYQWIDCIIDSILIDDTNKTFIASKDGEYAVIVTKNNCIDTSTCVEVKFKEVGIYENVTNRIKCYPNPVNEILTISSLDNNISSISIYSSDGKLWWSIQKNIQVVERVDMADWPKGIYVIELNGLIGQLRKVVKL